jgi:GNAT superfamily N-acetyltransferase
MAHSPGPTGPDVTVRVATIDDWRTVRQLRLYALREAPEAFWSTYEQWAGASDQRWRERVSSGIWLIAQVGDEPVGLASLMDEDGDMLQLVAMWVAPHARGRGVGGALVEHAVSFAGGTAAKTIELWVNEDNLAARRLYVRTGFTLAGDRQIMPGGDRFEVRMTRKLGKVPPSIT